MSATTRPSSSDAPETVDRAQPFTLRDQVHVSCAWLGYNLQWGALLAVVLPHQIAAIAGPEQKELFNGLVGSVGAFIALIVTPVAGALSDRSRHPMGRRRPFIISGGLLNLAFLAAMAFFAAGSPVWLFALCYAGVQFGCNWWGGPYAGLIPDVVPSNLIGRASGWQALMTAFGTLIGALMAGQLIGQGYPAVYALLVVGLALTLAVTISGVREQPLKHQPPPFNLRQFLRSFYIDPRQHRNFYWVLVTRALVSMGVYSVFTFFQYFLGDVIRVEDPAKYASYLVGVIIACGIPTSILAGSLSDRYGRKPMVYLSGGIMAVASIIFIAVTFSPNLAAVFAIAALFGLGNGAYQAADWALAVDVLPGGEDAAKDMGIWHVAFVLPQIVAPLLTALILSSLKAQSLMLGYTTVFVVTAIWFILGTVFIYQVRGVR